MLIVCIRLHLQLTNILRNKIRIKDGRIVLVARNVTCIKYVVTNIFYHYISVQLLEKACDVYTSIFVYISRI